MNCQYFVLKKFILYGKGHQPSHEFLWFALTTTKKIPFANVILYCTSFVAVRCTLIVNECMYLFYSVSVSQLTFCLSLSSHCALGFGVALASCPCT